MCLLGTAAAVGENDKSKELDERGEGFLQPTAEFLPRLKAWSGAVALLTCKLPQLHLIDLQGRQLLSKAMQRRPYVIGLHSFRIFLLQNQKLCLQQQGSEHCPQLSRSFCKLACSPAIGTLLPQHCCK